MASAADSGHALPSASLLCGSCSRPVVIIEDAGPSLWNGMAEEKGELLSTEKHQHHSQLKGSLESACGVRRQEAQETESSLGEASVVLSPVLERSPAQAHAESPSPINGGSVTPIARPQWDATSQGGPSEPARGADESGGKEDDAIMLHPLCSNCLDAAIAELAPEIAHEKRLIRKYDRALRRLERRRDSQASSATTVEAPAAKDAGAFDKTPSSVCTASSNVQLQVLEEEEKQLLSEISSLEAAVAQRENQQLAVMAEISELYLWQLEFWLLFSTHLLRTVRHEERKRSMERLFAYVSQELKRLKRFNTMNEAFHIWTSQFLPSINNCRIGRISSPCCPAWSEINTGWGYLTLLLDAFYRKCQVQPSGYRIVPRGQFSFLLRKKDNAMLPLHGGGGEVGLSRFFYSNKKFDSAMTAYLECVKELFDCLVKAAQERLEQRTAASALLPFPELPYEIEGDKVGGFSIRLQLNQDERWTKALKHLLIDMKWLLEYIERRSARQFCFCPLS
ncbi:beclin-1-like protein [Cyclospora cayetanensis]|uniref:Beclin-1-like protein n=1 Tax=Cyclospora cayetanensis TaxID=88456 RepID=A0A6P6RZ78_9EIME|nr:beclin-1-like protein [Cyclospora cayetanensis]